MPTETDKQHWSLKEDIGLTRKGNRKVYEPPKCALVFVRNLQKPLTLKYGYDAWKITYWMCYSMFAIHHCKRASIRNHHIQLKK